MPIQFVLVTLSVRLVDFDAQLARMRMSPALTAAAFSNFVDEREASDRCVTRLLQPVTEQALPSEKLLKVWHC